MTNQARGRALLWQSTRTPAVACLRKGRCAWLMLDTMVDALLSWVTSPLLAPPSCSMSILTYHAMRSTLQSEVIASQRHIRVAD